MISTCGTLGVCPFPDIFRMSPSDACCLAIGRSIEVAGANSDNTGPFGHGTAVASIAIGADGLGDDLVNCYQPSSTITTNMTISNVCIVTGFNFDPLRWSPSASPLPARPSTSCPTFFCLIQTNLDDLEWGLSDYSPISLRMRRFFVQRRDGNRLPVGLGNFTLR